MHPAALPERRTMRMEWLRSRYRIRLGRQQSYDAEWNRRDGDDVLIGSPNDTLTGGPGADTLVFNPSFGKETVKDYNVNQDVLAHTLFTHDKAPQVLSQTHDSKAGAVIVVDAGDTITLVGVTVAQLQGGTAGACGLGAFLLSRSVFVRRV
jgi:hypothetical protein